MRLRSILLALMLTAGVAAAPTANATIIMSIQQVGSDVLATASGDADITDLDAPVTTAAQPQVWASAGVVWFGPSTAPFPLDIYTGPFVGPSALGGGGGTIPTSASGSVVGFFFGAPRGNLNLPVGYISESALSATMTFASTTLAGLGLTNGVYTWTWGSGDHADSLTLYIGVPVPSAEVPVPASLLLLATGAAALGAARRRLSA